MPKSSFPDRPTRFCITDVGSTTTKAILFAKETDWRFFYHETPTTVEKPHEDVTVGVRAALEALARESGATLIKDGAPVVPYLSTSSAGGGLAMVVTGLVHDITAASADRVALGAGAIVLEVIAMDDGRTPYRKIEDLKRLRPDMVLLAGGFDGDAVTGPAFLAELLLESGLHPKLNPAAQLPVIYAGNVNARDYVHASLGDRVLFCAVPNVRPSGDHENFEPARAAIHRLFMDHVMSQAPGYESLKSWVSAPILPTPAAFAGILALVSRGISSRIMAIDIGGATTDVFTAEQGRVFRTVSANMGLSYSIMNVAQVAGVAPIQALLGSDTPEDDLWNLIGNKHLNPTSLPATGREMQAEWATAAVAIREAVRQHLEVMKHMGEAPTDASGDIDKVLKGETGKWRQELRPDKRGPLSMEDYGLIIGSGGILSHSPRNAAALILLDALRPKGKVELAVDSTFMFPHLGVLAEVNPGLAEELFYKVGIVRLGTAVCSAAPAPVRVTGKAGGKDINEEVRPDELRILPLGEKEELTVTGSAGRLAVHGGAVGLILDLRPAAGGLPALSLAPKDYVPARRPSPPERESRIEHGPIRMTRELAIPGQVFVKPGDVVATDTLVARSVRQFLRPFFLHVAEALEVPPEAAAQYLLKLVGDEIGLEDIIARRPRPVVPKLYRSPVEGRVEKMLPCGTLVVREKPEAAREMTAVCAAKELGIRPAELTPYLKCAVGEEVDRGQWLAAIIGGSEMKICRSPVRGKVSRIDRDFGIVLIEPLLEELQVSAWLPGTVAEVSEKGCVVVGKGTTIQGVWGSGGETAGPVALDSARAGHVTVTDWAGPDLLAALRAQGGAGLITGGLDLKDVLEPQLGFTVVVTEGFGVRGMAPDIREALRQREGRLALIDGTTQLRVGVRRPKIVLPD